MRTVVGVVVALLIGSTAFADEPPPLDTALAKAAQSGKPLVLEFYADWCKPCRYFDAYVLSRADVAAALKNVEFVRYDIDTGPGDDVATKLDVTGVPTIVVLDAKGNVLARHAGLRGGRNMHRWFIQLLDAAGHARKATEELERLVLEQPNNAEARFELAQHYKTSRRLTDAAEQYGWIVDNAGTNRELAAEAAAQRDAMLAAEARLADAIDAAELFVETYPESRLSSSRIAALAMSGRVAHDRLIVLAAAHLDAISPTHWPNAVRATLIADAAPLALRSVRKHLQENPDDPVARLVYAELMLFRGQLAMAAGLVASACKTAGNELWCYTLRQAIDLRRHTAPGVERLRSTTATYLAALEHPEPRTSDFGIDALGDVDVSFGNAVASVLRDAQLRCEYLATRSGPAWLMVELAERGRPRRVTIRSPHGGELERCVRRIVASSSLPAAPSALDGHLHGTITFDAYRARTALAPPFEWSGALPQIAVRRGAVETTGFRATASHMFGARHAWVLAGTTEFAGGDSGDPAYRLRGIVGLAGRLFSRHIRTYVGVGVGISDLGTNAPRVFEVPVEEHVRIAIGRVRLHLAAEITSMFPGRASSWTDLEMALGFGMSVPVAGFRLYAGAHRESRGGTGDSTLFIVGTPVGDAY